MILIIMGICGVGKTAVGETLAEQLGVLFRDADEFHSDENKCKMSKSIPLTDEDRLPWLQCINRFILKMVEEKTSAIVTCSALKKKYRQILLEYSDNNVVENTVKIIYLKGSEQLIQMRLNGRTGHFMPPDLLKSQLLALEEPDSNESYCITINTDNKSVPEIVVEIISLL